MTAVAKTYTFVPGTAIEASETNQNFDDIIGYINSEVIVRDASMAFTAIPSGPGTDPTTANQFARKQYVDNQDATITTSVTNLTTTVTNNKTAQDAGFVARPTVSGVASNPIIKATDAVVNTDIYGQATVTFPAAFPNAISTVVVSSGDAGVNTQFISVVSKSTSNFVVRCYTPTIVADGFGGFTVQRAISQAVRVSYVAVGY